MMRDDDELRDVWRVIDRHTRLLDTQAQQIQKLNELGVTMSGRMGDMERALEVIRSDIHTHFTQNHDDSAQIQEQLEGVTAEINEAHGAVKMGRFALWLLLGAFGLLVSVVGLLWGVTHGTT